MLVGLGASPGWEQAAESTALTLSPRGVPAARPAPGVPAELLSCKPGRSGAGHPARGLGARVLPVPAAGSCSRGTAPEGPQRAGGSLVGSDRAPVPKSGPAEGDPGARLLLAAAARLCSRLSHRGEPPGTGSVAEPRALPASRRGPKTPRGSPPEPRAAPGGGTQGCSPSSPSPARYWPRSPSPGGRWRGGRALSHPRGARGWCQGCGGCGGGGAGRRGSGESGCAIGGLAGTSKRKWLGHDTSPAGGCRRGPGASPAPGTAHRLLHGALVSLEWAGGCSGGRGGAGGGGDVVVGRPCTGDRSWRAGQRQESVHPWGHRDGGGHGPSFSTLDGISGCRGRRRGTPAPLCPPARLS